MSTTHVVGLSGGKDSTAMALRLAEVEPDTDFQYVCTPTGDELPTMIDHWAHLEQLLGKPLIRVTNRTLAEWIKEWGALPNARQRWCTRLLKIEPTIAYLKRHAPAINYVGLRADEPERVGIYGETESRFPLRDWGWGIKEVKGYLRERGVTIPKRTDCARCYGQQLGEWWDLWRDEPAFYADAEREEQATGHTFRSASRDTWPAGLADLRGRFELGEVPHGRSWNLNLFEEEQPSACRVCQL